MRVIKTWLLIKADGTMKIRTKRPSSLFLDEDAIPIVVYMPDGWGDIVNDQIDIHMPEPPTFEPVDPDSIMVSESDDEVAS